MRTSGASFTASPTGISPGDPARESLRILRWSSALHARVTSAPPEAGRVHSVFAQAVNLMWHDGGLVTLQGPGPLAAPFAAALARLPRGDSLTPGTAARRAGGRILLGPFAVDIEGGSRLENTMHPTDGGPEPLASVLAAVPGPVGAPGLSSPAGRWARDWVQAGIRCRNAEAFVQGACLLIGLGEGLTPAGDDCLVGALAILHRFSGSWLAFHPEIAASVGTAARTGTTTVGRDFILHALSGAFAESILDLVTATAESEVRQAAARLAAMGGTSGADTLDGMRIALEAISS